VLQSAIVSDYTNFVQAFDSIIIGAGAAGLYAALHAGRRGRRVLVLEHNAEPGAKIIISGGGRCNFTNINAGDHTRYLSANPHFARSALSRHTPTDFIKLIERHNIAYYEKTLGQLFCEGARAAHKIVQLLLDECAAANVTLTLNTRVTGVSKSERFRVETSAGAFESETLTIASGGLSIPKLGATGFAYDIARQFSVPLIEPRPGLVPLTFSEADLAWMRTLSGISADISARAASGPPFREAALFTHRGLSGPAILQISSYWRKGEEISIDWLPDADEEALVAIKRARPKAQAKTALAELFPDRLARALSWNAGALAGEAPAVQEKVLGDLKDSALIDAARALKTYKLKPDGTEGYLKAEVTIGGVNTNALSQQNMEVRAVPGLFFVGEAVDVTGWLGGYNFQWAWSSGWAAAQTI
jgi:predicted Rossmann fold flavoprotein